MAAELAKLAELFALNHSPNTKSSSREAAFKLRRTVASAWKNGLESRTNLQLPQVLNFSDAVSLTRESITSSKSSDRAVVEVNQSLDELKRMPHIQPLLAQRITSKQISLSEKTAVRQKTIQALIKKALEEDNGIDWANKVNELQKLTGVAITPQTYSLLYSEISNPERQLPKGADRDLLFLLTQEATFEEIAKLHEVNMLNVKIRLISLFEFFEERGTPKELLLETYPSLNHDISLQPEDFPAIKEKLSKPVLNGLANGDSIFDIVFDYEMSTFDVEMMMLQMVSDLTRAGLSTESLAKYYPYFFNSDHSFPREYIENAHLLPPREKEMLYSLFHHIPLDLKLKMHSGAHLKEVMKTVEQIDDVTLYVKYPQLLPRDNTRNLKEDSLMTEISGSLISFLADGMSIDEARKIINKEYLSNPVLNQQLYGIVKKHIAYGRLQELQFLKNYPEYFDFFEIYERAYKEVELMLSQDVPKAPSDILDCLMKNKAYKPLLLNQVIVARWILNIKESKKAESTDSNF